MKKIDFKNRKVRLFLVLAVCVLLIGGTYAYWRLTVTQTGVNEIASSCFDITLTNEQNDINLQKAYPISNEEGMSLTPYTFTITNNCDTFASYSVNLELLNTVLETDRLSAGFVKAALDNSTPTVLNTNTSIEPTLDNAYEAYELTTGYLDANESVTYNLRLWMDGAVTVPDDAMNKQLESKITITASYIDHIPTDYEKCVAEYGEDSIQCSILAEADSTGTCPTVNDDGIVDIREIEDTQSLLCSAPDDYGTSYYYRGNVDNNYVKFAGFYWRILRINGDGSIRMIYAGDADVIDSLENKAEVLANGYNDTNTDYTQIGESDYNSISGVYGNNAGVGYMYGENIWGEPVTSKTTSTETLNNYYYYYADSYTFDTTTGTYTLTNPTQAVWSSELVGKYTCSSTSTSCTTLYAIDSYYDSYRAYVYSYTRTSTDTGYEESHGTSTSSRTLASYNYYGTSYTFNKSTGTFTLTGTSQSVYDGSQVGMYTCGSTSSSCSTLYYVESTDSITTANVRTISRTGTTYEETHANINNSSVKTRIDTWYEENIANHPEYAQYISDTLFCNDRSFNAANTGTGTGTSTTYYRWNSFFIKTLKCTQQNDRFTVDDERIGNGDLTYPVGLLTADEAYLAGGYNSSNSGYYLYTGNYYWIMSPSSFNGSYASVRYVSSGGIVTNSGVSAANGVRPVINLNSNSLTSGDGSASNPFLLSVE